MSLDVVGCHWMSLELLRAAGCSGELPTLTRWKVAMLTHTPVCLSFPLVNVDHHRNVNEKECSYSTSTQHQLIQPPYST